MASKRGSSARVRRTAKKYSTFQPPDSEIDFSDIPELTDEQLAGMKRVGRPLLGDNARQMIAIRIDPDVLAKLRKEADRRHTGYQTLINEVLARWVKNVA
jgi:uncharacterized protein (DUF4415 family)